MKNIVAASLVSLVLAACGTANSEVQSSTAKVCTKGATSVAVDFYRLPSTVTVVTGSKVGTVELSKMATHTGYSVDFVQYRNAATGMILDLDMSKTSSVKLIAEGTTTVLNCR